MTAIILVLMGCSFAPKYAPPPMPIPLNYQEYGQWVAAKPSLPSVTLKNPWWMLYHDETLNQLENKVTADNFNLKLTLNRYQEALALADITRSALYPSIIGLGTIARQKTSGTVANSRVATPILTSNSFIFAPLLTYEVDAWGRIRNAVIASDSLARASQFDLASVDLSLHALLASTYFQLRGADESERVLHQIVKANKRALFLTRQRHQWGLDDEAALDNAITQYETAKTADTDLLLQRAQLMHAIAVLVGEIPANFSLPPQKFPLKRVTIAPEMPSTLLERRPDIAAAERRANAANATIGVARAAFFPAFNFSGLIGSNTSHISKLFKHKSLIWALGPAGVLSLTQPEIQQVIFDGFLLQAQLAEANASFYETINAYKQTVLTAFQEVEDQLVAIRRLDEEYHSERQALMSAKRAWYQANRLYQGGAATFLNVVGPENTALSVELDLISIKIRRQLASVGLIKALGGGWHCSAITPHTPRKLD